MTGKLPTFYVLDAHAAKEKWFVIPGFDGWYSASTHGRVRTERRIFIDKRGRLQYVKRKIRKPVPSGKYLQVTLQSKDGPKTLLLHQVICTTFSGPCPAGMECRHLDGNPHNCKPCNLKWGTQLQNAKDRVRHGTQPFGTKVHNAILTPKMVRKIREMKAGGLPCTQISRRLGLKRGVVYSAASGTNWGHIL